MTGQKEEEKKRVKKQEKKEEKKFLRTDGRTDQSKVVQKVLADLKNAELNKSNCSHCLYIGVRISDQSKQKLRNMMTKVRIAFLSHL